MENLYYVPISLVEHVLFEDLGSKIGIELTNGEILPLEASNLELQQYYQHYYVDIQNKSKGIQFDENYKIPIGIELEDEKPKLISFDKFKSEFDKSHISRIDSIILKFNGEEKEYFIIQIDKELLEDSLFEQDSIYVNIGKYKVEVSTFTIPVIVSSLSENDKKAVLVYEEKEDKLELFGLLLEPDFDNPSRKKLTLKKL